MKIGLVGEAPSDTQSIQNLLEKKYSDYEFISLLKIINGSSLDSQKTKRFLRIEYEIQKPDIVVFIRDLDSILPNKTQLDYRKNYFTSSNRVVDKKGISLLHIFEIEALILSDINTFNDIYNTSINEFSDVMVIPEPKELLKKSCKSYSVSDNPEIFKQLDFEKLLTCSYFARFIENLDKLLN